MRRKILAVFVLAAAGMLMLTACTSSKTGDQAPLAGTEAESDAGTEVQTEEQTEAKENGQSTEETSSEKAEVSAEQDSEDIWTGNYLGDTESITIQLKENHTMEFSFEASGISGTADVDGAKAVYKGDDDHILTFQKGQGLLSVTVSHAEGYDTSASPLNGTYVPSY